MKFLNPKGHQYSINGLKVTAILGASAVEGLQSTGLSRLVLLIGSIEMFNWVTKRIVGLLFHHLKCGVCGF